MLPRGIISLWYGSIVSIPAGWTLCDGSAGTPDLRDRFLVGAGSTYAVNATGGSLNHIHSFTSDGHFHTLPAGSDIASGFNYADDTDIKTDSGITNRPEHLPPYHALCYIMKT